MSATSDFWARAEKCLAIESRCAHGARNKHSGDRAQNYHRPQMIDTHASRQYCTYVGQSMRKHPTRPGAEECATVLNMMPATLSRGIPPIKIGRKSRAPSQRQCSNAKANASDGLALERVLALLELHARRALRASLNRTLLHQ